MIKLQEVQMDFSINFPILESQRDSAQSQHFPAHDSIAVVAITHVANKTTLDISGVDESYRLMVEKTHSKDVIVKLQDMASGSILAYATATRHDFDLSFPADEETVKGWIENMRPLFSDVVSRTDVHVTTLELVARILGKLPVTDVWIVGGNKDRDPRAELQVNTANTGHD